MIADWFGLELSHAKARKITGTDMCGTSIFNIVEGSKIIGLKATALQGTLPELIESVKNKQVVFPLISHTTSQQGLDHFVVVYEIKGDKVTVADPATGITIQSIDQFQEKWTGYIISFAENEIGVKIKKKKKERNIVYFEFLQKQIPLLTGTSVLSVVIALTGICTGFTLQIIVDGILQPNPTDTNLSFLLLVEKISNSFSLYNNQGKTKSTISIICVGILLIYFIQYFSHYLRGVWFAIFCRRFEKSITLRFIEHIIDLPYSFLQTQKTGDIINRYSNILEIEEAIVNLMLTVGLDAALVVIGGIVLFSLSPMLCLLTFTIILSFAIIAMCFKNRIKKVNEEIMTRNGLVMSFIKEILDGAEPVRSTASQQWCKRRAEDLSVSYVESNYRENILCLKQSVSSGFAMSIGLIAIIWGGATSVSTGNITLGTLLTFYSLIGYFFEPIKNILDLQPTIQKATVAAGRLDDIFEMEIENVCSKEKSSLKSDIRLNNITYRYNNGETVIDNLNAEIKQGTMVGIVGRSGCGKTTLAKLLTGLIPIKDGTMMIGDKDYSEIHLSVLRQKAQYVPQFSFFFADTIKENITLGLEDVSANMLEKACVESNVFEFINQLPFGFNTILEENASNLSAGQRQRLAIARALIHAPDVLILDEATSNIDNITEKRIIKNLLKHKEEMTIILITHNVELLKTCDELFVMENGMLSKKIQ